MSTNHRIFGYTMDEIIHSFDEFNNHFILGQLLLNGGQGSIYATAQKQKQSKHKTKRNKNKKLFTNQQHSKQLSVHYNMITKSIKLYDDEYLLENKIKSCQEYMIQRKLNMIHYNGISYGHNQEEILLTMEMLEYTLSDCIDFNLNENIHDFNCNKSEYGLKYFILEVTSFLHELHSMGYVHLDINPNNIMFRNYKNEQSLFYGNGWKVIDLGLCEYIDCDKNNKNYLSMDCFVGTIGYTAPEIDIMTDSDNPSLISFKADIWSLGVVILYIINGYNVFDYKLSENKQEKFIEYKLKLLNKDWINTHLMDLYLNNKISFQLYDLLSQCFEYDVKKRLSAKDVLKHPLFTGIVFENKRNSQIYCYRNKYRKISKQKYGQNNLSPFVPLTRKK